MTLPTLGSGRREQVRALNAASLALAKRLLGRSTSGGSEPAMNHDLRKETNDLAWQASWSTVRLPDRNLHVNLRLPLAVSTVCRFCNVRLPQAQPPVYHPRALCVPSRCPHCVQGVRTTSTLRILPMYHTCVPQLPQTRASGPGRNRNHS